MIPRLIINVALFILRKIIAMVLKGMPWLNVALPIGQALATIISTTSQANNFIHFLLGNTAYIILPIAIGLIGYKYVLFPILNLIIGIFVNKSS